jgi:phosphatidylglycerophosphate synthase
MSYININSNKIDSKYECPMDVVLLKFIDTHLDYYYKLGFTPNMITTISIFFSLVAMTNILNHNYKLGALFVIISYYFDCVDGKLARKYNLQTKFGDYYDHFSDIFKIVVVLYALYKTNALRFKELRILFIILLVLMMIHLGYQEVIYNRDDSPTLYVMKYIASHDKDPKRTIQYTKLFGCGTFVTFLTIIIYFWNI